MSNFDEQAAGFFAAEGHFHSRGDVSRTGRVYSAARLDVSQKERCWPALLKEYYEAGHLRSRAQGKKSYSPGEPLWAWEVNCIAAEALYAHYVGQPITPSWVTGFYEGDGTIFKNYSVRTPRIEISSHDRGPLELVQAFLGAGSVITYRDKRDRVQYKLCVCGEPGRELTLQLYENVISPRRKAQLEPYVEAIRSRAV